MKNLIILTTLVSLISYTSLVNAQHKISQNAIKPNMIKPNTHIQNNALNKFLGKYSWEADSKKLVIEFVKYAGTIPVDKGTMHIQLIKGNYNIYINGKIQEIDKEKFALIGSTIDDDNCVVFNISNDKLFSSVVLELLYIDQHTLKLRKRKVSGDFNVADQKEFPLPLDILLKKP